VVRRRFVSAFPSIPRLLQPPKGVGALERLVFSQSPRGLPVLVPGFGVGAQIQALTKDGGALGVLSRPMQGGMAVVVPRVGVGAGRRAGTLLASHVPDAHARRVQRRRWSLREGFGTVEGEEQDA